MASVTSRNYGIINHHLSFAAVSAVITKDDKHVHELLLHLPAVLAEPDGQSPYDEWILGRAGYLYLLRMVKTHLLSAAPLITPAITEQVIDAMLKRHPIRKIPGDWPTVLISGSDTVGSVI